MGSAQLMMDAQGTPTKIPVDNPHRNKYRVISTPHLSDSYYQGASGSAWYLFANPNVLPAFEIVFLNGRRTPVIERVEMPAEHARHGLPFLHRLRCELARPTRCGEGHRRVALDQLDRSYPTDRTDLVSQNSKIGTYNACKLNSFMTVRPSISHPPLMSRLDQS